MFFCFVFKTTGICSVLCLSGRKSLGIYSIFCFFASLPQETSQRRNAVIYSISWVSKSQNLSKNALCWAHLGAFCGACWAILRHPEPSKRKRAKATKCCKTQGFLGSAAGGAPLPLTSFGGGGPTAVTRPVGAWGPLAGFKGFRPCRRPRKKERPRCLLCTILWFSGIGFVSFLHPDPAASAKKKYEN